MYRQQQRLIKYYSALLTLLLKQLLSVTHSNVGSNIQEFRLASSLSPSDTRLRQAEILQVLL